MDPELVAIIEEYCRAHGLNVPPPEIMSDLVIGVGSTMDGLLSTLGAAANLGDPTDNADAQFGQAERDAGLLDAETKFPANEEQSAQLLQTLPQTAAGVAGAVGGVFSGLLQGLAQIPQQVAQGATQALQASLGALQQGIDPGADLTVDPLSDDLGDDLGDGLGWTGDDDAVDSGGGLGNIEGTAPTGYLGPPPSPSPATAPASAQPTAAPAVGASPAPTGPRGGMSAMPLMPPGAMYGGNADSEAKTDTKRVVAPSVKNGAPVQGRITAPAPPPVTKRIDGKPVATRRVVAPGRATDDEPDR